MRYLAFSSVACLAFLNVAVATTSAAPQQPGYYYCPPPADLLQKPGQRTWYAKGGWKSYDPSFLQHVTKFLGAQWSGVNLGQLACIYTGTPGTTFPVKLISSHYFHFPGGLPNTKWGQPQPGLINCKTHSRFDCPLVPVVKQQQGTMMEQLRQIKPRTATTQQDQAF